MIDLGRLWAEIEADQTWRIDELRLFQNRLTYLESDVEKDQFRRALVLLLYAHFEGFCRFALLLYVGAVNKEGLKCNEVNAAIVASSLHAVFQEMRNPSAKSDLFRHILPDDSKLHRIARDREFIEEFQSFEARKVEIPEDIVDTESNLKPAVLRKNLFQLGFPHDQFKDIEGDIHRLLRERNNIAHGQSKEGMRAEAYQRLWTAASRIMDTVKADVMKALSERRFLRSASN